MQLVKNLNSKNALALYSSTAKSQHTDVLTIQVFYPTVHLTVSTC